MSAELSQKALEIAVSQEGVSEQPKGSNRGPEVDEYLRSVGLDPKGKYAWCAAFVYWCFAQAATQLQVSNPVFKTAGVLNHWNKAKARKILGGVALADPNLIKPGMIFIMKFGGGTGHTGFVRRIDPIQKLIYTVEGNTNDDGSREGYEVALRKRPISSMFGFIDYSE